MKPSESANEPEIVEERAIPAQEGTLEAVKNRIKLYRRSMRIIVYFNVIMGNNCANGLAPIIARVSAALPGVARID